MEKCIGNHVTKKSKKTQYGPSLFYPNFEANEKETLLKIKINKPSKKTTSTMTYFSFPPSSSVEFKVLPLEPDKEYFSIPKSPLLTETSESEASIFEPDPENLTADESDVSEHFPDPQPIHFQCKTEHKFIVFWS